MQACQNRTNHKKENAQERFSLYTYQMIMRQSYHRNLVKKTWSQFTKRIKINVPSRDFNRATEQSFQPCQRQRRSNYWSSTILLAPAVCANRIKNPEVYAYLSRQCMHNSRSIASLNKCSSYSWSETNLTFPLRSVFIWFWFLTSGGGALHPVNLLIWCLTTAATRLVLTWTLSGLALCLVRPLTRALTRSHRTIRMVWVYDVIVLLRV